MSKKSFETQPIAVFYEHPQWFEPLFEELDHRGVPTERLLAHQHSFDPADGPDRYALVFNRMSPSAFTRGHGHAIPYTLQYLAHLEQLGTDVIGGFDTYLYEFSKARQLALLERLGLRYPASRVIGHPRAAPEAAGELAFPVIVKPNVGGSGAGIQRFDTPGELTAAALTGQLDLGPDGVGLVQEYHPPTGGSIVRVEVLGGELLYAIELRLESPDSFNLCPADYCKPGDASRPVRAFEPPSEVVEAVRRIASAAGIEVGGVEYLVSERDGETYFYDVNALSNFVADAPAVVGFDPWPRLVDYVLERSGLA